MRPVRKSIIRGEGKSDYGVTLERLGLASTHAWELLHAPLFQAVFDYRQGAAETGTIGGASFTEIWASRERTPHDVVLEIVGRPGEGPAANGEAADVAVRARGPSGFLGCLCGGSDGVLDEYSIEG